VLEGVRIPPPPSCVAKAMQDALRSLGKAGLLSLLFKDDLCEIRLSARKLKKNPTHDMSESHPI